ncbi:DALR anticodon-binding domain-containing protein [Lyngbya sp. PCC 8106]|uniref:DALR anticodon-binding domain-containing protein n=1 Tax=Lyngbya sp. (strain PCC 8106) TaxID=313612 RepID=UPI0000EAD5CB|nr:DALR anticodon-binding domain-containing protein [Lyngbya sp. PCC 8106]EAW37644.1 Arginyl tRNA synthetase, anticodon binding [Lyngbya sp. PCC 8106]
MDIPRVQYFLVNQLDQQIQDSGVNIDPLDIPVYPLKDSWPIRYHSAIALKLAKIYNQNPLEIATKILQCLLSQSEWVEITIDVIPSGIIIFELTDQAVVAWLKQMTQTPLPISLSSPLSSTTTFTENYNQNLFAVQYSHARCCSLLRLADRDHIITIAEPHPQTTPPFWLFINPNPIPWLDINGKLQLNHASEQQLIWQLLTALDACYTSSETQFWQNKAHQISDAFQAFYSQCQIWGEVKLKTPKKAQARLGLISVTQALLRYILQEKLAIIAPLEL